MQCYLYIVAISKYTTVKNKKYKRKRKRKRKKSTKCIYDLEMDGNVCVDNR